MLLNTIQIRKLKDLFLAGLHGLEKEGLRVLDLKKLSNQKHPLSLGEKLTHPNITTDYAESQLEFVTAAYPSFYDSFNSLKQIQKWAVDKISPESLWPFSPPCFVDPKEKVKLARFGFTEEGYLKWLYRKGLQTRYGNMMQLNSGVHYNFSFSKSLFVEYAKILKKTYSSTFVTQQYFHVMRNVLRLSWLCSYLFGASPAFDKSYFSNLPKKLLAEKELVYHPYATSLRMSYFGYYVLIDCQKMVSFNSLTSYLKDLKRLLKTSNPHFNKLGVFKGNKQAQINSSFLQVEAEHYSRIRPKADPRIKKRPIEALKQGVFFLETRFLDLNPLLPMGLDEKTLAFVHLLMIYCLLQRSPKLSSCEAKIICDNQNKVAIEGRNESLKLNDFQAQKKKYIMGWGLEIIEGLKGLAQTLLIKDPIYFESLAEQEKKLKKPFLTPSARVLKELLKEGSLEKVAQKLDRKHQKDYLNIYFSEAFNQKMKKLAKDSIDKLNQLEGNEDLGLAGYRDMQLSTQALIREAFRQELQVKVLDRKKNIISIESGLSKRIVCQATITDLDTTYARSQVNSKARTKEVLSYHGINVPKGFIIKSFEEAIQLYPKLKKNRIVVKPSETNMGQGISFIEPNSFEDFKKANKKALRYQCPVIIEEFFSGKEYRFLVIDQRVAAVCRREPPSVIGDGVHALKELLKDRNQRFKLRRAFQKPIYAKDILANLKAQGLSLDHILKKGEKVLLKQNSNVSTGGESYDVTDEMPTFFKKKALLAVQAFNVAFCGVDMLIEKLSDYKTYCIIELNQNPALFLHRYPNKGPKRFVEKEVLKALGF